MAKMIAVWGSPASGKTTFTAKLAGAIYDGYQSTVLVLCADQETPVLPVLFPNRRREELFSVGKVLAGTEVTQDSVISQIVTLRERQNFGFLGFTDGENRYTYPKFDESKVRELFAVLGSLANYVLVDCTGSLSNVISCCAVKCADEVIRIASPDLKSISWQSSQLSLYADPVYRLESHIQGLNVPDEDLYMPVEDARAHLSSVNFTIPYSRVVKQQMLDGKLWQKVNDRAFNRRFEAIVEKVV